MIIIAAIYTCSLCANFDSNQSTCAILNKDTYPQNSNEAMNCKVNGVFVRDINVQFSYFNYEQSDSLSSNVLEDLSKLPKDRKGIPLFVLTKRGVERAVPAYPELELESHHLLGVKREYTYQGQRELIYEIGVDLARKVCAGRGVSLIVLDEEKDMQGIEDLKVPYLVYGR